MHLYSLSIILYRVENKFSIDILVISSEADFKCSILGGRRDARGGNSINQDPNASSSVKKDMRFRRTSSCSDADVSETSFIDMLKSNAKKPPQPELPGAASELSDSQGGRGGKKKGRKGRQIDPALLGFKVTSNRIMMGEIQRVDD